MLLLLAACAPLAEDSAPVQEEDSRPPPAELEAISGDCPAFGTDDKLTFTSNDIERTVHVLLPSDVGPGLPVLFEWHPLGATSKQLISYLDLDTWAEDNNVIVIVPEEKDDNMFEWDFWNGQDDDFVLYDDVRSCLAEAYDIDLRRVYTSGMSAGGLMTSALAIERGDTLAAILPMSGGTPDAIVDYATPAYTFPALLTYGGDTDTWGGGGIEIDFQAATLAFAGSLYADGHYVVACNHNGGHDFPPDAMDLTRDWLLPHVYGEQSPLLGDISMLPDICSVWTDTPS